MKEQYLDNLILTTSSGRQCIIDSLKKINIIPGLVLSVDIDTIPVKGELPQEFSMRMAYSKSHKIHRDMPDHFVFGVETIIACGRRILIQAKDIMQAEQYLRLLSGRRHRIYTSICLFTPKKLKKQHNKTVMSIVKFKHLSEQEIQFYLNSGEWKNMIGGYDIYGLAGMFILFIRGSYSAISGLPLHEIYYLLNNYFNILSVKSLI
ncbi:Maf family protein [Wolbachia endosymbiont of Howardula sp.]|nr:Maf family protein [Wolbachia endosymbiont of Howardula sp.]UWI83414.1 Maf family protein [Wolbachia endosymbiont of Howardula sp.]